mmetsp:Transcript_3808/g.9865  ORF Transcript_3808/g.9865 Transcript_3808/m.9865 type:complete len:236 (-) Transcript_3808:306-1013(-)
MLERVGLCPHGVTEQVVVRLPRVRRCRVALPPHLPFIATLTPVESVGDDVLNLECACVCQHASVVLGLIRLSSLRIGEPSDCASLHERELAALRSQPVDDLAEMLEFELVRPRRRVREAPLAWPRHFEVPVECGCEEVVSVLQQRPVPMDEGVPRVFLRSKVAGGSSVLIDDIAHRFDHRLVRRLARAQLEDIQPVVHAIIESFKLEEVAHDDSSTDHAVRREPVQRRARQLIGT